MEPSLGVGQRPLSAGLRPFPTVPPFPEGLHPSPGARFPLSTAQSSSLCSLSQEVTSPVLASHGRPAEEEQEPFWEEAGAQRQG